MAFDFSPTDFLFASSYRNFLNDIYIYLCRELVRITGMDVIQWTWWFFHITSGRINTWKGVNQLLEILFLNLCYLNIYLKLTNHRYFMIKNPLFFTIHSKNGVLLQNILSLQDPCPISRPGTHCLRCQRANARGTCDDDTIFFPAKPPKSGGRKKILVMIGHHSIQLMLSI